ncbi:MAG TPA: right-handed parallel beta-helix repeat-containing protein [Longimicrobiales bacterium]|nr:right-handed parallel beta-helix repeat-containing protein [Longimicrobiales bacterium]
MKKILLVTFVLLLPAGDGQAQTSPVQRVTTCASNGAGSLPQLVRDAPSGTRIVFDFDCTTVASQFIHLDSAMVVRGKSITIDGNGHIVVIVACTAANGCASKPYRIFTIGPTATLRAVHLHMMNGRGEADARTTPVRLFGTPGVRTHGGGIYVNKGGTLYLDDSQIEHSYADEGGAIFNEGKAVINNVELSDNAADLGGSISNAGDLTLSGSTLSRVKLVGAVGGGMMNYGTATVSNSTISDNHGSRGAGILNEGTLTLVKATITQNTNGGMAPPTSGNGLLNVGGTVTISNSNISGNGDFPLSPNCVGPVIDGGGNTSTLNDLSCGFAAPAATPPAAPPAAPPVAKTAGKAASSETRGEKLAEKLANGTFQVTTPTRTARGEASYICQTVEGRTKLSIIFAADGLMGGIAGTVTKRGPRNYEIIEDEERGFTAGFGSMQEPFASYPATTGVLTITEWSEVRLRGTFTYSGEVEDANGVAQKHTVSGSFNAKPTFTCS